MFNKFLTLVCLVLSTFSFCSEWSEVPVSYKGRFRAFEGYRLLAGELFNLKEADGILPKELFLIELQFAPFNLVREKKIIPIKNQRLKMILQLDQNKKIFTYDQVLKNYTNRFNTTTEQWQDLERAMNLLSSLKENDLKKSVSYDEVFLRLLPAKKGKGEWLPLFLLDQSEKNFSAYSDNQFFEIKEIYQRIKQKFQNNENALEDVELLGKKLKDAYRTIAGTEYIKSNSKFLHYPSLFHLKMEFFYYHYPWIDSMLLLYALSILFYFLSFKGCLIFFGSAFSIHTGVLLLRCFILERPPVSNMFETVIYVPYITACSALILALINRFRLALVLSAIISIIFLGLLQVTSIDSGLENVQAVLDSQYWLIIHVLMVVGSYGLFFLAGALGHYYLLANREKAVERLILKTLYVATALLIGGTILGGVWAAQSWGRFWDWDPKESWAFISSCIYLCWIHAYRFGKIRGFGLAIGSVIGLTFISFTWYGVNYILGTGLHSYGFGNGGEIYFYFYLLAEVLFVTSMIVANRYSKKISENATS
ncbi:MAG: hypothetical protein BGO10_05790 [Chlamydia sp. 32-24]|nr:MAG: hypothetical protein BGO10_05790 [Chlamydia sp. 32-24]